MDHEFQLKKFRKTLNHAEHDIWPDHKIGLYSVHQEKPRQYYYYNLEHFKNLPNLDRRRGEES